MANHIRIVTDPAELPDYQFPYGSSDTKIGYSVVQQRGDAGWEPRWLVIDMIGTPLCIIEADDFADISAEELARQAANFIMELHGLGEEDTGEATDVQQCRENGFDSFSYDVLPPGAK